MVYEERNMHSYSMWCIKRSYSVWSINIFLQPPLSYTLTIVGERPQAPATIDVGEVSTHPYPLYYEHIILVQNVGATYYSAVNFLLVKVTNSSISDPDSQFLSPS
jgi:hypothetical protein